MNAETIKDFLISLGFDIDEAGSRNFETVVSGVTMNVVKMGAAVEAAALTVVGFTTKIASGLDRLYWQSQRTGATANNIRAIGYAFSQAGGSVEGFNGTLDNLSRFLRSTPGAEGFLRNLGVQTRDAAGNLRDTAQLVTLVGDKLAKMPYYRANQYAQILGIDESTLLAMRRGVQGFTADYQGMLQATGFDSQKAAEQSNKFMTQMRGLTNLFGIMRDKIGGNLAGGLAGNLESFRKNILLNFPKIEGTITALLKKVLSLADSIITLVYRGVQGAGDLMRWWDRLDDKTKGLVKVLGGLLVAWKVLNSAFLTSPIGMITALIAALVLLYDDYQTWKEGGDSLIDWAKWQPDIEKAKQAMLWIRDKLLELKDAVGGWKTTLEIFAGFIAVTWASKMVGAIGSVTKSVGGLSKALGGLGKVGTIGALLALEEQVAKPLEEKFSWLKDNPITNLLNNLPGSDTVNEWGKSILPWRRDEVDQHGQSVKRPRPTKDGAALLGWLQPTLGKLEALYNLPAGLLRSVAITESSGNQFAVSGAGAKGLFQFMPGTARDMGLRGNDVFDPEKSAAAAAKYLSQLLKMNGGDLEKALASYNWGIGNVQKHGMGLMPQETRNYIPRVLSNMPGSAGGGQGATTFNINVQGGGDPRETARLTGDAVEGVYRRQTRNMQTQVG